MGRSKSPVGPAGSCFCICCADMQTFFSRGVGVPVAVPQLVCNLRRNSACRRMRLDIFDHLDFGLTEITDQLAGFDRRRMRLAGSLDQPASPLSLCPQRKIFAPAFVEGFGLGCGAAVTPPSGMGGAPLDGNGLVGEAPTSAVGELPFTRGTAESLASPAPCASASPPAMARMGGNRKPRNEAAEGHGWFFGRVLGASNVRAKRGFRIASLTTHSAADYGSSSVSQ